LTVLSARWSLPHSCRTVPRCQPYGPANRPNVLGVGSALASPVASQAFVHHPVTTDDGTGIRGGVGGGPGYESHAVFYVGVPDVGAALQRAEDLGGTRVMGPVTSPNGLVVGHFKDPEGTLIGMAGTA